MFPCNLLILMPQCHNIQRHDMNCIDIIFFDIATQITACHHEKALIGVFSLEKNSLMW